MNTPKKNKLVSVGIASQGPLRTINKNPYNPLIHTPPVGLEKHIVLEPTIYPSRTIVRQKPPIDFKPGPDMDSYEPYGQFVELGGKRRKKLSKRRRSKRRHKTRKLYHKYK
uniref:Uncharacterized protein n=1 Tax=viral metagenome TaxID=1070528 RepID=A0A6C0E1B6_9ZZZZ